MRLILLTLFFIAAVDGGIIDKVKGVFSGEGSFGQKLKNATIVGFKKVPISPLLLMLCILFLLTVSLFGSRYEELYGFVSRYDYSSSKIRHCSKSATRSEV